jgi:hypothetical protein
MNITKTQRTAIRAILADSSKYDPATMRVNAAGYVTAKTDPNKTFNAGDATRYVVSSVEDMVDEHGNRREGW